MNRFYEALSKLLSGSSTDSESLSSDFLSEVTLSDRDTDLDERSLPDTQEDESHQRDVVEVPVAAGTATDAEPVEASFNDMSNVTFDVAEFTDQKTSDGDVAEIEAASSSTGEAAAVQDREETAESNLAEVTQRETLEEDAELSVPIEQFQLDEQSPEEVIAVQERDVEETEEAVVTTAYGSDVITKSLIPNDLGFDFNEVVQKIDEDLNLSVGFDNLTFSESNIVIPDLTPIPGHVFDRENVFASATNMKLMDTSE